MKNILVVHRERNGFEHKQTSWKNYTFHFVDFCLHYMFRVKDGGEIEGMHSREKMENVVQSISTNAYDAVYCEAVEAFLLQFVMLKKGMEHPPFIIMELNSLVKARSLCRWIASVYGEDPFENILSNPTNFWSCYAHSELSEHEALGIDRKRLFYVPCSLYFQDETMTAKKGRAKLAAGFPNPLSACDAQAGEPRTPFLEALCSKVIAGGNNSRDYETLLRAADGLPFEIHIFSSDFYAKNPACVPANVHVHDYVLLETLYDILSVARFVVVPLHKTYLFRGIATTGLAIGFEKPVIASDFPCLHDYVINGETGILVKPNDPVCLRKAILELYENDTEQRRMSKNAKKLSAQLDAIAEKNLEDVFKHATSCIPRDDLESESWKNRPMRAQETRAV